MVAEVVFVNSWSFNPMNKIKKGDFFFKVSYKTIRGRSWNHGRSFNSDLWLRGPGAGIFQLHNTAGRFVFLPTLFHGPPR